MIWFAWWTAQHIEFLVSGLMEFGFSYLDIFSLTLNLALRWTLYMAVTTPTPVNIISFLLNWGFYGIWALFLVVVCYMVISKIRKKVIE